MVVEMALMIRRAAPLLAGLMLAFFSLVPAAARADVSNVVATPVSVTAYAAELRRINPHMQQGQSLQLARQLLENASRWHVDTNVLAAIVTVESAWHTGAVSHVGAIGLGQLMPGTAAVLGVDPHDPGQNLEGAAHYLSGLLQLFGANPRRYELAFAAYNAGPKAVQQYGGIPPYSETQRYVLKVLRAWHHFDATLHVPEDVAGADAQSDDMRYWTSGRE